MLVFTQSTRSSCHILMKLEFSRQVFEKYKFQENPSTGSRGVPYGRTDKQTDITKLRVAFAVFERA